MQGRKAGGSWGSKAWVGMLLWFNSAIVLAAATPMQQALDHFARENYEEALALFLQVKADVTRPAPKRSGAIGLELLGQENLPMSKEKAEVLRFLGLCYFNLTRYAEASGYLKDVRATFPRDESLLFALAEIELVEGKPGRSLEHVRNLRQMVSYKPEVRYLEGRAYASLHQDYDAAESFQAAIELSPNARQLVGLELAQAYVRTGRIDNARTLLENAIEEEPAAFNSRKFRLLLAQLKRIKKPFVAQVGVRLESDSNVILEPSGVDVATSAEDKADTRITLIGDVMYQQSLSKNWTLYHEGHLYNSNHQQLSEFDQLQLDYIFSPGYSGNHWGYRLPLEISWSQLNGAAHRNAFAFTPGVYKQLDDDLTLSLYGQTVSAEYDEDVADVENRSGSYTGVGGFALWYFNDRDAELRFIIDSGTNATDGSNWERSETNLYLNTAFQVTPEMKASIGVQTASHDYANTHTTYLEKRSDSSTKWFASYAYLLKREWEFQARISSVKWESNIDVYNYERNVFLLSVVWRHEARSYE